VKFTIEETEDTKTILVFSSVYEFPEVFFIEPDASTAAYDALIASVHGDEVNIQNINQNSIQGESKFIE
jgi:5-enolpyruvylshikimate-3-phosphate synthase